MPSPPTRLPTTIAPQLGPVAEDDRAERDRFDVAELAIVLSHYDLGVIHRLREYRRGSRRSPKLRIGAERGEFLLKRRAPGREDPRRVAFAHDLQLRLASRRYPVPELVQTRSGNTAMVHINGRIYEVFRYVAGTRDDRSPGAAAEAGAALGRLHRLLADHRGIDALPAGSYHAAAGLDDALRKVPAMVVAAEPTASTDELKRCCTYLRQAYRDSAGQTTAAGLERWARGVIHGDWHPGNLLYRDGEVVAVLDFDSARIEPRMIDVANAALQFSMTMTDPEHPQRWPVPLDVERMRALLQGYDREAIEAISPRERRTLPWLILEALILESIVPIAATGRFGQISGRSFLGMVERKVRWLRPRARKLAEYVT